MPTPEFLGETCLKPSEYLNISGVSNIPPDGLSNLQLSAKAAHLAHMAAHPDTDPSIQARAISERQALLKELEERGGITRPDTAWLQRAVQELVANNVFIPNGHLMPSTDKKTRKKHRSKLP